MRLEDKFFNSFFYLFLIGVFISIIIVSSILLYYSKDFLDKNTSANVYFLEKKFAESNINIMNVLLSNLILKLQVSLQEQITFYENTAKEIMNIPTEYLNFKNKEVYNLHELRNFMNSSYSEFKKRLPFVGFWLLNPSVRTIDKLDNRMKKQYYAFSLMIQSMYSIINEQNEILKNVYFLFEGTELYLGYPFTYFNSWNFLEIFDKTSSPAWCTDVRGEIITYYKYRCRPFYTDIMNAQKESSDLNWKDQTGRTIFVTSPYPQFGDNSTESVFSLCIKFHDIIANNTAYICGDSEDHTLFSAFDNINNKLNGYVSIISVGFNKAFYVPQILSGQYTKTLGEFIYRIDNSYYLEEKTNFMQVVQKYLTSNYIKKIEETMIEKEPMNFFDELIINNDNQFIFKNNIKYNYCLYPIVIENMDKNYEHVLSLIYIFSNNSYYNHILDYQSDSYRKLIFQIFLYIFFVLVLLYIISLSFKSLAKIIVIPIKNIHYMLEGINIGGEYRLEYLNDLRKKQEDNLIKLNKINLKMIQNNKAKMSLNLDELISHENKEKEKPKEKEKLNNKKEPKRFLSDSKNLNSSKIKKEEKKVMIDSIKGEKSNGDFKLKRAFTRTTLEIEKLNSSSIKELDNTIEEIDSTNNNINLEFDEEFIDTNINYEKKYDSDGIMIEKELNFYDFDEELLQYRPHELNNLVQSLLNLKSALILTSKNQNAENIINYTNSEYTFNNFKNKVGSRMCQSNVGNLQSRLLKYDKAIYHLALSLQNVQLKKFFSSNINDELDESDSLLYKIERNYKKNRKEKETNKLIKKQQREKKINFPQKIIEILINSRYNKLIHIYYKFFSFIRKNNFNYEKLGEFFMHTNFHTINYYHKILIQYIYLCFVSNDLVKIGESILDYIQFLIKFKLKISEENSFIMNIYNKEIPEIKKKQLVKRKYFDKIINWINLFDNYAKQINENSALGSYKNILDAYNLNLQTNNMQLDTKNESASALLFQINLQRYDFLRGKFALECKDYTEALGFMINAAKSKRIVIDGLIKKKALKHIAKIAQKVKKHIGENNYSKLDFYNVLEKDKIKNKKNKDNNPINTGINNENELKIKTRSMKLIDKMKVIIDKIDNDINETNEKQLKDIIILIDCNLSDKLIIDSFIDVTKTILKNYLANNDRICVFFLLNEYRIICPMKRKEDIDFINFVKDIDIFSEKIFKKEKFAFPLINEELQERLKSEGLDSISSSSDSNLNNSNDLINNKNMKLEDTIKAIYYSINYLKMKEISINENYFIFFSNNIEDFMNYLNEVGNHDYLNNLSYESNKKNKIKLKKEENINFLAVGKYKDDNEDEYKSILINYFGEKSEMIPFDNMKKIKSILASTNIINDNIIFPNEVYQ